MRRRTALTVALGVGVTLLLASYVVYTQRVVRELQREAQRSSRMFARVLAGQADSSVEAASRALFDLITMIREAGVPLVVADSLGRTTATANVPERATVSADAMRNYIAELDAENTPVIESVSGTTVHFGSTQLVRGLRVIPFVHAASLGLLLIAAVGLLFARARADREGLWAGMARETAHQIGTPLSSLHGWIDVLRDRHDRGQLDQALDHMSVDIERLERVAHRFERIGRPPKDEQVDVGASVERIVAYFAKRAPTLATPVVFAVDLPSSRVSVRGDRVLLEWVLEALVRNAVDALSGIGGTIAVSVATLDGARIRIRVADDGPGVPSELRTRIFDAGFSTKERGWGIGLALTQRIVEQNHAGKLSLVPSAKGAVFDVILPA
ncbi:MAG TPA: HAMP domain-containing sensor histidine kinase [Gemmatimonadaceae bacterium]|nr:HAMP domain-containing sensor histidine kinase [Gemmatimonadaceae bacterium]